MIGTVCRLNERSHSCTWTTSHPLIVLHICPRMFHLSSAFYQSSPKSWRPEQHTRSWMWEVGRAGGGDCSLLLDADAAGSGSSWAGSPARVPRASVPATNAGYEWPLLTQRELRPHHLCPPVPAGLVTSPQQFTERKHRPLLWRRRVSEKLQLGFKPATAGHAHARPLTRTSNRLVGEPHAPAGR